MNSAEHMFSLAFIKALTSPIDGLLAFTHSAAIQPLGDNC